MTTDFVDLGFPCFWLRVGELGVSTLVAPLLKLRVRSLPTAALGMNMASNDLRRLREELLAKVRE